MKTLLIYLTLLISVSNTIFAQTASNDSTEVRQIPHQAYRSPWAAFMLSTIFPPPGGGQIYNGDYQTAIVEILAFGVGVLLLAGTTIKLGQNDGPHPHAVIGLVLIGGSKLHSMIDAPISAAEKNKNLTPHLSINQQE